ncbi:uncharacterized protein [Drosophila bipectinata]|uniref:uncharacterized protein n=1 Tax=Drosophila bipectinata TaxID=42026 RepID=UPI001C892CC4|nr:uncharacterized protein LOC122321050 [Drosophila bipectinata]
MSKKNASNAKSGGQTYVSLIIDSGSRYNLICQDDWSTLKRNKATVFNVRPNSQYQFKGYASDQILNVICVFEAPISVGKQAEMIASFLVIEKGQQSLLGRETAIKLEVLRLGLQINHIEEVSVFPKWKGDSVKLAMDQDIKPVQQPMRRIPIALEGKVREKTQDALKRDIIEPVNGPSAWISPMVLVFKENGDIRLCLDSICGEQIKPF